MWEWEHAVTLVVLWLLIYRLLWAVDRFHQRVLLGDEEREETDSGDC